MVVWTEEMKAKRAATWARKREKKAEREARKAARHVGSPDGEGVGREETAAASIEGNHGAGTPGNGVAILQRSDPDTDFDWEDAPLQEAIIQAANLKREYERVAAIIVRRQNPAKQMWTCWSVENPTLVPLSVKKACLKRGEDGKWKFRDDGRFVMVEGVRTLRPAFCCNYLCYTIYSRNKATPPAPQR